MVCFVFARLHYWFSSSLNNFYMFLNNDTFLDSSKGWWSLHTTVLMSLERRFCLYLDIFLKKTYRLVYGGTGSTVRRTMFLVENFSLKVFTQPLKFSYFQKICTDNIWGKNIIKIFVTFTVRKTFVITLKTFKTLLL